MFRPLSCALAWVLCCACGDVSSDALPMGSSDGGSDEPDVVYAETSAIVVAVETRLSQRRVSAGTQITVRCQAMDAEGRVVVLPSEPEAQLRLAPLSSFAEVEEGALQIEPRVAGEASIACALPGLGLIDPSAATLTIEPGPPVQAITELVEPRVEAGIASSARCFLYDAWDNRVAAQAELRSTPTPADSEITPERIYITQAGIYDLSCDAAGVIEHVSASLEVHPAMPALLGVTRVPDQMVYRPGQVVGFDALVSDRFNNIVPDAPIQMMSAPMAESFGRLRLRFPDEGRYTITVEVPDESGFVAPALRREVTIDVDGGGPLISCEAPVDGQILEREPGQPMVFSGFASDGAEVAAVWVNDTPADLVDGGLFSAEVMPHFGVNLVDVRAEDTFGRQNSRLCSFLVAPQFHSESAHLDGSVTLRLDDDAVDDGQRNATLNSLADLLYSVLNARGLRDALHDALLANNPLKPRSCDAEVLVCVLASGVDYRDMQINGPNDATLTLVSGGLRANADIRNLRFRVRVYGQVSGIPYDTVGWVTMQVVRVGMTFDLSLRSRRPDMRLREINYVTVGDITTDFDGIDGGVINIVASLFEGTVRTQIENLLRDYVQSSFDEIVSGVLSGLDISAFGASFDVPRLSGRGSIPLSFDLRMDSLDVNSSRAFFEIGTRFGAPKTHGQSQPGVPLHGGDVARDPGAGRAIAGAINIGLVNQVLHVLWRAGFLHVDIGADGLVGDLPPGVGIAIEAGLPPVAGMGDNGDLLLTLGALRLRIDWPEFLDAPLVLSLGGAARVPIELRSHDQVRIGTPEIVDLRFSAEDVPLDPASRAALEALLRPMLQGIADEALSAALPAFPIPSFEVPASLSRFGLPAGRRLGIWQPELTWREAHAVLKGDFRAR